MSRFMRSQLQPLKAYVPGEQPKNMDELIKLNTNESPYPPSPAVAQAIGSADIERLRLYNDPDCGALRRALAEDLELKPEQISVGNGSDEVLYFAMMAFGERGAAFPDITYGFYTVWAKLLGMDQRIIPLEQDFSVDPSKYTGNDRMILLANPNAPTGIALRLDQIEEILRSNPDSVVLIDEAYVDFGGESAVTLLNRYDNLLVSRTFSKSRQMAGARLGFLAGGAALIEDVEKIRNSVNPYNVDGLTQKLGIASVVDRGYFDWARAQVIDTREWTAAALRAMGFSVLPSETNFVFAKHEGLSGRDYMEALRTNGILVRWFDAPRIKDYVRITIGTAEQMQQFAQATQAILGEVYR